MKLAKVYWEDAHGVTQEWSENCIKPLICHSIGYLEDKDTHLIIIPHYDPETKQGCGKMAIPKSAVKDIEYLKPKRLPKEEKDSEG